MDNRRLLVRRPAEIPLEILLILVLTVATLNASAQSGNAGTVRGTVTDPSGAVIPNAAVHLTNPESGLDKSTTTDAQGQFTFSNIPFNPYQIAVSANGFGASTRNVEIRSSVGTSVKLALPIAGASSTVKVEAQGDLVEDDPTFHTDVDRDLFIKVPLESASSTLSSLVTLTTPGVAATPGAVNGRWAPTLTNVNNPKPLLKGNGILGPRRYIHAASCAKTGKLCSSLLHNCSVDPMKEFGLIPHGSALGHLV